MAGQVPMRTMPNALWMRGLPTHVTSTAGATEQRYITRSALGVPDCTQSYVVDFLMRQAHGGERMLALEHQDLAILIPREGGAQFEGTDQVFHPVSHIVERGLV